MPDKFKTAVVVVHGMGSQKPRETVYGFVQTALKNTLGGGRIYYSRPDKITDSYEARRLLAIERKQHGSVVQTQTEFFEYHWSYMMKDNQIRDLLPTCLRLLAQSPRRMPWQLLIPWLALWAVTLLLGYKLFDLFVNHSLKELSVKGFIEALVPGVGWSAVVAAVVFALIGWVTSSFVDVVRYLDTSPRSYEVRRAIRAGMVDLLRNLHADDRYSRVIVVAHSLGGYIAYDGLTSFWDATDRGVDRELEFSKLAELQAAAQPLSPEIAEQSHAKQADASEPHYGPTDHKVVAFRQAQFELWTQLRENNINWRITDFVTLGTPMYIANILMTKNRRQFNDLKKRSELPQCPPRSDSEKVEQPTPPTLMYGRRVDGDITRRLVTGSPFAVVRWSNFWFRPAFGLFGDPFGGSLATLFGHGIDNREVTANKFGRYVPFLAHTKYFKYADLEDKQGFVATVIRTALSLDFHEYPAPAPSLEPRLQGSA